MNSDPPAPPAPPAPSNAPPSTPDPADGAPPAPGPSEGESWPREVARRRVLTAVLAGTIGGGLIGTALPSPGLPDLPNPLRVSSTGRQTGRSVAVYGGNDIN